MRRIIALTAALSAGALTIHAPAARAAPTSYTDPEGDANGLFYTDHSLPLPSEPALDITRVIVETVGGKVRFTARIKKLTAQSPPPSTGYYFRFGWTYAQWRFRLEVSDDPSGSGTFFVSPEDPSSADLPCAGCIGMVDPKTSTVVVTAPLASLNAGMRQWQGNIPPAKPGSQFRSLEVIAQRSIGLLTASADVANGGDGVVFTL